MGAQPREFPANRENNREIYYAYQQPTGEVTNIHGISSTGTREPAIEQGIEDQRYQRTSVHPAVDGAVEAPGERRSRPNTAHTTFITCPQTAKGTTLSTAQ